MGIELFLKDMGAKIAAIRQGKKISQRELSKMCELDYNRIIKIESGKEDTDILTLYNIAYKLDVDIKDLI